MPEVTTLEAISSISESVPPFRDVLCCAHLRWSFVWQRPQHILTRCTREHRVFYWEEPEFGEVDTPSLKVHSPQDNLWVVTPQLPSSLDAESVRTTQEALLQSLIVDYDLRQLMLWLYTPMALTFTEPLHPVVTVYDCMDQLSAFHGAPPDLMEWEKRLLDRADVVFTGGHSLYDEKRRQHPNVHAFPSSVECDHFAQARQPLPEPAPLIDIPHPRVGFYGVVDERLNTALLAEAARLRPDLHWCLVGPVVKIDPASLPQAPNLHWLPQQTYADLPAFLAHWDVAMMPFALNAATAFISPTKTLEYLAAGKPVVSTSVRDVVRPYGEQGLVAIADTPDAFVSAVSAALEPPPDIWDTEVSAVLARTSWDRVWQGMYEQIRQTARSHRGYRARRTRTGIAQIRPVSSGFDYLIVGAGFAGSVLAERLASDGERVLVVDRRPHIGGNAFDQYDAAGVLIHPYGPHIFHTQAREVFEYLSKFTEWRAYEHRVLSVVDGQHVPIPINLTTINQLYGWNLTPPELETYFRQVAEPLKTVATSEDVVVSKVGRDLYEKFFRGYTRKQWGLDPSQLDKSVIARIPTRTNTDDRYFGDPYQVMPLHGYTRMFERMLSHPNIKLMLNTDYREIQHLLTVRAMIYSGPVDEFFNYCYGRLPYRSLQFHHETHEREWFQPVGVVNYPNDHDYTRITEFKHLTGQRHAKTSICYEFSRPEGDPYYPVPRAENQELYQRYKALADATPNVHFVGRLATYKYINMDQAVGQALTLYKTLRTTRVRESVVDTVQARV